MSGRKAAEIEAREEAGVYGRTLPKAAGTYHYWKRLTGGFVPVQVTIYMLAVEVEANAWKEAEKRQRTWLRPRDAATLVDEPELASLIQSLAEPESPLARMAAGRIARTAASAVA